ncbi:MAG TPA: sialidase family protein [Acidimicrobiales bacterium]|nr:sialidase family protein [Acidimicrobiales bacterium]
MGDGSERRRAIVLLAAGAAAVVLGAALGLVATGPAASTRPRPSEGDETPVTPMDLSVQAENDSPLLLADPVEPRFVVMANRVDFPGFGCALQVSGDGGRGWAPDPLPELPDGVESCYAPEVAFDRAGRLYYLFVGLAGPGHRPIGAWLVSSNDHGRTFSKPRQVLSGLKFGVRMAIDHTMGRQGRMYLTWIEARSEVGLGSFGEPPNPIMAAYSDDGGGHLSTPVQVSDRSRSLVVAPALALGPHHAVHVVYYDLGGDRRDYSGLAGPVWDRPWSLVLASSTDGGRHFAAGRVVDDGIVPTERVMLIFTMPPASVAVDGSRLCAAWTDGRSGDPDAVLRCSADGGRRFEALHRLNDDSKRRQYLPRLAVAPGGRIDAVFLDRRNDPVNRDNDVYYTYSTDGGRHFAPNLRLTSLPSNSHIGAEYAGPAAAGQYEIGGRLGLLSVPDGAVAAWPDMRNAVGSTRAQDLVAVRMDGMAGGGTRPDRPLGLAVTSGGAGAVVLGARRLRRAGPRAVPTA